MTKKVFRASEINSLNLSIDIIEDIQKVKDRISNKKFPCFFAATALSKDTVYFGYIRNMNKTTKVFEQFFNILSEFSELEKVKDIFRVLVVIFDIKNNSWGGDDVFFWNMINYVVKKDQNGWLPNIPQDANNSNWTFCFRQIPFFININSNCHQFRRSRNIADKFTLVIQRRDTFDSFATEEIRTQIRSRLLPYDNQRASKYLGEYADHNNLEWHQYHLPDSNKKEHQMKCPFSHTQKGNKNV